MAASSTDAFSNNSDQLSNGISPVFSPYPVVSVTTGPNHFWPSDATSNSTSPSSDHNWDIDEEESIKRKIYELKRQFHNGRYLIVRHLPRDATEEDVREVLSSHLVHSVQIHPSNGTARVLMAEPEVLENWPRSSQHSIRAAKVTISPSNTEGLLCLARLPKDYLEEEFSVLVSDLGDINYCFLMRSEKTGESKGYGFVEYISKEVAMQAKAALDGRELRDTVLVCDWLEPTHVTYASLHSSCLYVDRLPKDYRDMGEFRRIFSRITNPPYCQIAMKQGALQDWGLAEFNNAEEAEETRNSLNCYKLKGQPIRVEYYVPGVRAINIYMKLLNDPGQKKSVALFPEPPTNKVFVQLRNLTKHNPAFAKSLQNIILTQIQNLQQKGVGPPPSPTGCIINGGLCPEGLPGGLPLVKIGRGVGVPPPLRVPPPITLPPHLQYPPPSLHQPPPPPLHPPDQPLNSNAQAALVILLAAQLQQQQEQLKLQQQQVPQPPNGVIMSASSNILSNPQVLNLLQTLVSQGDPLQHTLNGFHPPPLPSPTSPVANEPGVSPHPPSNILSSSLKASFRNGYFKNGVKFIKQNPLLPTPPANSPTWIGEEGPEIEGNVTPILNGILGPPKEAPSEEMGSSISSLLSNAHNLQQLLGSLNPDCGPTLVAAISPHSPAGIISPLPPHSVPSPLPVHPQPTLIAAPPPTLYQAGHPTDPVMSLLLRAADNARPESYLTHIDAAPHQVSAPYLIASPLSTRMAPPTTSWAPIAAAPPQALFPPAHTAVFSQPPTLAPRLYSPIYLAPARNLGPHSASILAAPSQTLPPHIGYSTPISQKRKSSHFLPSPEPSPENGYVGQHSQGIGGHYADSYGKKKKKH